MFPLPMFKEPKLPRPRLKLVVPVMSFWNTPAKLLPILPKPEPLSGVPKPKPVLSTPEMLLPRLARPDCSEP
ncbi:hypothetical protein MYIN104542_30375 [Mycobacterium intermedium]